MNIISRTAKIIALIITLAASVSTQASEQPRLTFKDVPEWPKVWQQLFHDYLGEEAFHLSAVLLCASDVSFFTEEEDSGAFTKDRHIPYIMGMQQLLRDPENPLKAYLGMHQLLNDSNKYIAEAYKAKNVNHTGSDPKLLEAYFQRRLSYGDQLLGALERTIARKSINFESLKGKPTYWLRLQIEESLSENERAQILAQARKERTDLKIGLETNFIAKAYRAGLLENIQDQPLQELKWFREDRDTILNNPEAARKLGLIQKSERVEIDPQIAVALLLFKGIGKIALGTFRNMKDSFAQSAANSQRAIAAGACPTCLGRGRENCSGDGVGEVENCLMCQGSGWRLCRSCGGAGR